MFRFILILLCLPALAADRRPDTAKLTVAALNVQFLWDGIEPEEGKIRFARKGDQAAADAYMQRIAQLIIRCNADMVSLSEVENLAALKRLNDKFLSGQGYAPYLVQGRDEFTGQDVALLTRIDPEETGREDRPGKSGDVTKSVSKNYYAKFRIGDRKIALIGLHLLAKPSDEKRLHKRQAQADALKKLAVDLHGEGYALIVLGDFNDYDGGPDSGDHLDHKPITKVLEIFKELDPATPHDNLINVSIHIPKQRRYTSFWDMNGNKQVDAPAEFSSIDHILISGSLGPMVTAADVINDFDPRTLTDHFPVIVHFAMP